MAKLKKVRAWLGVSSGEVKVLSDACYAYIRSYFVYQRLGFMFFLSAASLKLALCAAEYGDGKVSTRTNLQRTWRNSASGYCPIMACTCSCSACNFPYPLAAQCALGSSNKQEGGALPPMAGKI